MKPLSQRSTVLIGVVAFCAAMAIAWFLGNGEQPLEVAAVDVAQRPSRSPDSEPKTAAPPAPSLVPTPREPAPADADPVVDIFATKSWVPPPPPPPPPAPPAPPEAPPLPFSFLGVVKEEAGKNMYYLAKGEQAYGVTDGQTIDGTYRVNGLRDQQLSFTYLPMRKVQTLSLPAGDAGNQVTAPSSGAPNAAGPAPRGFFAPTLAVPPPEPGAAGQPGQGNRGRSGLPARDGKNGAKSAAATPSRGSTPSMFSPPPAFDMERAINPSAGAEETPAESQGADPPD